ncbi:unnamed protein product [Zymoseptoria tritici ST99CH_3D7]|uniref:AB hydrolase-1 domain-containing protein n=1 Tax=Zymoseptoria tritici (strain ST99CH_3D7) TaxID=1276538 RepID=A0A1X7S980_ZYMT9|nr:unnamed protein product [Zymoseptoria tritici ST99CH_3D7]
MLSLGYQYYAVQAGDWGAMVARELGAQYSEHCRVMHLNWCPGSVPEAERGEESEREKKCREQREAWRTKHVGYALLMRTRPRTVGWIAGTPEGLVGFVGEKYEEASNSAVHHKSFWLDHIHTTMSLYYMTNCIATSALSYYENPRHDQFAAYCSAEENLVRFWYKERDHAGHFACLEDPEGMIEDIREVVDLSRCRQPRGSAVLVVSARPWFSPCMSELSVADLCSLLPSWRRRFLPQSSEQERTAEDIEALGKFQ